MTRSDALLDNPLLVKHVRSRLRPGQMLPWLSLVVVVCLCVLLSGEFFGAYATGTALSIMLGLEMFILVFLGAQQVGAAVSSARESGILDFHRVSPQPPSWLTLGFFLGAPIREYVFFLATVPFALFAAMRSPGGVGVLITLWVGLLLVAWVVHAIALLGGLVGKKPKGNTRAGLVGLVFLGLFLVQPIGAGVYFAATQLRADTMIRFFSVPIPWFLFVVGYLGALLGALLLACARKMRSDFAHVYRKAEAVGVMSAATLLMLGGVWGYPGGNYFALAMIYALTLLACVLISTVTPTQAEYVRGVRRALHRGMRRPSAWSDEGTNKLATILIGLLVFLGPTILWEHASSQAGVGPELDALAIAVGVFVAAYFGFAYQYFLIRMPRSGSTYMALFIILAWLLPLITGAVALGASNDQGLAQVVTAISPIAGIGMSSGLIDEPTARSARFAAIGPASCLAFFFGFLLTNVQRRLDRAVKSAAGLHHKPAGPFDYLEASGEGGGRRAVPEGGDDSTHRR